MATTTITPERAEATAGRAPTRLAPWAGFAFVICFVGSVISSSPPANNASDHTWIANYTGSANKAHHVITGVLLVLAALTLLIFITSLWRRITAIQASTSRDPLPIAAAAAGAAAIAIGGVVMGSVATIVTNSGAGVANLFRLSNGVGFALVALAGMPAIALSVALLCVHGRRAGVFGRGIATFGIVAAIALLGALAFVPIVLLLVWVATVSVSWLRSPVQAAS